MASNFPLITQETCPSCGVENEGIAIFCSACQSLFPPQKSTAVGRTWKCGSCQFINIDNHNICTICEQVRSRIHDVQPSSIPQKKKKTNEVTGDEVTRRQRLTQQLLIDISKINWECYETKKKFIDKEFPPTSNLVYCESSGRTKTVKGWRRAEKVQVSDDEQFLQWEVFNNPEPTDVVQGRLHDCWLLAAMSLIAERPDLLKRIFVTNEYNKYGAYGLQLFVYGEWINVIVDDLLPCDESGQLVFAQGKRKQLWIPLLEKAFAKVFGGYGNLGESGTQAVALKMLTGCPTIAYFTSQEGVDQLKMDMLYEKLSCALKNNFILSCNVGSPKPGVDLQSVGLCQQHSYSLLSLKTVFFEPLMRLRNPHDKDCWTGKWSEHSDSWSNILPELRPEEGIGGSEQGIFWISMDDFVKYFQCITVCYTRDNWFVHRLIGQLPVMNEKYIDSFQLDIKENAMVDIDLQRHTLLSGFEVTQEAVMIVYDERRRVVGSTPCAPYGEKSWTANLLTPGCYSIYMFSHTAWIGDEKVPYTISCYSNKAVTFTKVTEKSKILADVIYHFVKECGDKKTLTRRGDLYLIVAMAPHWLGFIHVIVNESEVPSSFKIWSSDSSSFTQIRPGKVHDIIPAKTRQISQIFTSCTNALAYNKIKSTFSEVGSSTKVENQTKITKHEKKIHRLMPLEE